MNTLHMLISEEWVGNVTDRQTNIGRWVENMMNGRTNAHSIKIVTYILTDR